MYFVMCFGIEVCSCSHFYYFDSLFLLFW